MLRVRVFHHDQLVRDVTLENTSCVIGRHPGSDIQLDESIISRRHARIIPEKNTWVIEDLGSTNGTFIGGKRITHTRITGNEEISIGPYRIAVEDLGPDADDTAVVPPEGPDTTQTGAVAPGPGEDLLTGEPGCLCLAPEGSLRFSPLPPRPGEKAMIPDASIEITRNHGSVTLSFPEDEARPAAELSPEPRLLPSGFTVRLVLPDEILFSSRLRAPGARAAFPPLGKFFRRIKPHSLLIPVLAGVLVYLLLSPSPSEKTAGQFPPPLREASLPPESLPGDEAGPSAESAPPSAAPIERIDPLPIGPESDPHPPTSHAAAGPAASSPVPDIAPAREAEIVLPSEPIEPDESEPQADSTRTLLDRGFARYLKGELRLAREEWSTLAETLPLQDPNRNRSRKLAQMVDTLRNELILGYEAEKQHSLPAARGHWEIARAIDREIFPRGTGPIYEEIEENLCRVLVREGEEFFQTEDYPHAFRRWKGALAFRPDSPDARRGLSRLETIALTLYREAYLLESANREEATGKYQLILKILPPDHEYYQKSVRRLQ